MDASLLPRVLRFGVFEVDLRTQELRKQGNLVRLHGQPFQILAMLLEHPADMVTRDELRQRLWPADTFVDFDNSVNAAINRLREALGDSAENPRFVETLPRRGYRFIAPVVGDHQPATPASGQSEPMPALQQAGAKLPADIAPVKQVPSRMGELRIFGTFAVAAGVAAAVSLLIGFNVGGLRQRLLARANPVRIQSIAVLPLENLTGDASQDYFADGMTDALITDLAQISALRVISRTSIMRYKGAKKSLPEIGRELNVDAVVEGTVVRSGERVRIDAQLIQAASDRHLWARGYDRDLRDILVLQGEVAQSIANEIQIKLTQPEQARLAKTRTVDPEAYGLYLKGSYLSNRGTPESIATSIGFFQQAIERDPQFALGYAGLADAYHSAAMKGVLSYKESVPKARAAAIKALELDDTLAEAHTVLGDEKGRFEYDLAGAEKSFQRAIELNPNYPDAHSTYALSYLLPVGRFEEAISEVKKAVALDPLSLAQNNTLGFTYLIARRYDLALEQYRKTIEMDPTWSESRSGLALLYDRLGRYEEGIAEDQKAGVLGGVGPGEAAAYAATMRKALAKSGGKGFREKVLEYNLEYNRKTRAKGETIYVPAYYIAFDYARLGNREKALQWLEKSYQGREEALTYVNVNVAFDFLHSDPRYADLLRRLGLSQ